MSKRSIFRQYADLKRESNDLKARIAKLEKQLSKLEEEGVVRDMVYGGEGGIQPFHIEGIAAPDLSRVKTNLYSQKLRYEEAMREVDSLKSGIDESIRNIDDAELRLICRYYFIDGRRQQWIAMTMHMDQATVSRKLRPFGAVDDEED